MFIRSLFLAVIALLVAQAVYAYAFQEPYPSFLFPDFQGAPDGDGPVRLLRPRITVRFTDSRTPIDLPYQLLLEPAPGVVADAIVYTVFAPPSSDAHPRSTPGQFRLFLEQPDFAPGARARSAALRDPRTRVWLRRRLAQLYPGRSPRSLEIRWEEHRYITDGSSVDDLVTTVSRLRVPLDG